MNFDDNNRIVAKYPMLYAVVKYLECGDGWISLIDRLSEKLEGMIGAIDGDPDYRPCATQVKEKYGGLRVYVCFGTDAMYDAIETAESESYKVCEMCGKEGSLKNKSGWFMTLCDKCGGSEYVED